MPLRSPLRILVKGLVVYLVSSQWQHSDRSVCTVHPGNWHHSPASPKIFMLAVRYQYSSVQLLSPVRLFATP